MNEQKVTFLKFISIIQRNTQRFFDSILEEYHIGGGQQFFLRLIYENNGITMYDLAKSGNFDKGTVTKAIRKLEELGYVKVRVDDTDRRMRHLYITKQAKPVIEQIYQYQQQWKEALISKLSLTEEEIGAMLKTMAENSCGMLSKIIDEKGAIKHE